MFGKSTTIDSNTAVINNTLEIELRKISNRLYMIACLLQCFLLKQFDKDPELVQAIQKIDKDMEMAERGGMTQ